MTKQNINNETQNKNKLIKVIVRLRTEGIQAEEKFIKRKTFDYFPCSVNEPLLLPVPDLEQNVIILLYMVLLGIKLLNFFY